MPSGPTKRIEAYVLLKNPSTQDVTDWEAYHSTKYGVTGGDEIIPAAIALVTNSTTHSAATNTKAVLESFGYAVNLVADSAVTTHDFGQYVAVVDPKRLARRFDRKYECQYTESDDNTSLMKAFHRDNYTPNANVRLEPRNTKIRTSAAGAYDPLDVAMTGGTFLNIFRFLDLPPGCSPLHW